MNKGISIGIIALFIVSAVSPMVIGFKSDAVNCDVVIAEIAEPESTELSGLMDSPWSMYCHDVRHTGRSPYSTIDNSGFEKWRFSTDDSAEGDVVIDNDGTIYIGSSALYAVYPNGTLKWKYDTVFYIMGAPAIDEDGTIYFGLVYGPGNLYALYSNGTLKWKYDAGSVFSSPAIGNDGTIYFGDDSYYINALYPNGTLRWKYQTNDVVYSSPAIGEDGMIYCGSHDKHLYALYPNNGTVKWKYKTGHWIRTAPCIGDDGTIYVVSLDYFLHAVNPNGTMRWKTNVGAGTSPTIGQDGTIYAGYRALYAINPTNGSVKWTFNPGADRAIRGGTPCNSVDGTIFFGTHIGEYDGGELIAVNPDGTERWRIMIATDWVDSAPAIAEDGTIYVGSANDLYHPGSEGYLHAIGRGDLEVDANGPYYGLIDEPVQFTGSAQGGYSPHTWHWDFGDTHTSDEQNPAHIYNSPGNYTVTLTVTDNTSNSSSDTTWAKIKESNNPPDKPTITGETYGKAGTKYNYVFVSTDSDGDEWVWYYIDWDDGNFEDWIGPYEPGKAVTVGHTWSQKGTYIIRAKARDYYGGESEWATLEVTMPKNKPFNFNLNLLEWLFGRFPHAFPILRHLQELM